MAERDGDGRLRVIADRLYAAAVDGFVARRTAEAREARAAGDRDLAARIGALPKPAAAAAVVNALAHADPAELQRVLDLGAALHEAQEHGDAARLRALGTDRRRLLAEVADRAVELRGGPRPGDAVLEEVRQTLQAALQRDDAARAVQTGRLVRALAADGLEPVDLARAVAVPDDDGEAVRRVPTAVSPAADGREGSGSERGRQRREAARRRADEADAAARHVADDAERAHRERDRAESEVREREEAVDDLRARLDDLRRRVGGAERAADEARSAADAARAEADRAREVANTAIGDARRRREEADRAT